MYTTVNNEGLLDNYATEPEMYYAAYPSPEQQRNYTLQGAHRYADLRSRSLHYLYLSLF